MMDIFEEPNGFARECEKLSKMQADKELKSAPEWIKHGIRLVRATEWGKKNGYTDLEMVHEIQDSIYLKEYWHPKSPIGVVNFFETLYNWANAMKKEEGSF